MEIIAYERSLIAVSYLTNREEIERSRGRKRKTKSPDKMVLLNELVVSCGWMGWMVL